ncbi:MAG: paraquat-inducible protein A, partial [Oceanococcaceae bacterium]
MPGETQTHTSPWPLRLVLIIGTLVMVALTVHTITQLRLVQELRADRAELESIEYGMLDAQAWVDSVIGILEKRIREFDFGPENRVVLLDSFSRMLDTLMVEVDAYIRQKNAEGTGWQRFVGRFKQNLQDFLIDFRDLRTQAPEYAEAIMIELNKPEAREDLILFMTSTLRDLTESTFTKVDRQPVEAILVRYDCAEINFCRALLDARARHIESEVERRVAGMLLLAAVLLLLVWQDQRRSVPRDPGAVPYLLLLGVMLTLMTAGVLTPMMAVEARIAELRLSLLGEEIAFADQVLYFQSKSVADIVMVMIEAGDAKSWVVGVLIMSFSVLFPLLKVMSGAWLLLTRSARVRAHAVLRFFALKSSKWSMADVMVVAILMAYLGFAGLMDSQL